MRCSILKNPLLVFLSWVLCCKTPTGFTSMISWDLEMWLACGWCITGSWRNRIVLVLSQPVQSILLGCGRDGYRSLKTIFKQGDDFTAHCFGCGPEDFAEQLWFRKWTHLGMSGILMSQSEHPRCELRGAAGQGAARGVLGALPGLRKGRSGRGAPRAARRKVLCS